MIAVWDPALGALVPTTTPPREGWVHAVDPTDEELVRLQEDSRFPPAFIAHALDVDELARVYRRGDARLIVLRVPARSGARAELPFSAMAVGVLLTRGLVLTVARRDADVFGALLRREGFDPSHHERFVMHLLLATAEQFLAYLHEVDGAVGALEEELQESLRNKEVYALLRYQKVLVHFSTALSSDRVLAEHLMRDPVFHVQGPSRELLEDVEVELRQAAEMTSTSGNILGEMMDAFASIISNNLNVVMKAMAAITIILAVPTLVASVYGMNVSLPGQRHPLAFTAILFASAALSASVAAWFVKKRWF